MAVVEGPPENCPWFIPWTGRAGQPYHPPCRAGMVCVCGATQSWRGNASNGTASANAGNSRDIVMWLHLMSCSLESTTSTLASNGGHPLAIYQQVPQAR